MGFVKFKICTSMSQSKMAAVEITSFCAVQCNKIVIFINPYCCFMCCCVHDIKMTGVLICL